MFYYLCIASLPPFEFMERKYQMYNYVEQFISSSLSIFRKLGLTVVKTCVYLSFAPLNIMLCFLAYRLLVIFRLSLLYWTLRKENENKFDELIKLRIYFAHLIPLLFIWRMFNNFKIVCYRRYTLGYVVNCRHYCCF
jgi:hypothetical protein